MNSPQTAESHPCTGTTEVPQTESSAPFESEVIQIKKADYIQLKWEANYYCKQYQLACDREKEALEQIKKHEATIRDLKQRLYGKKGEKKGKSEKKDGNGKSGKPRGQQKGKAGHGRTKRPDLPVVEEEIDVADNRCSVCHKERDLFPGTEDSEVIEVEVSAYKRKIKRKRYKKCKCEGSGIITAPAAPKLLPKTNIGISIWRDLLLNKVQYNQATNQFLKKLKNLGCPISPGTIAGGLKRLIPFFEPLQQKCLEKQLTEKLFGADETTWKVFEEIENKVGYRWYLWVTHSKSVVFYHASPGRNAEVMMDHFKQRSSKEKVFLMCDRYSAYKRLARELPWIVLAFCWAHVRRDFLDEARSWPDLKDWMLDWVEDIGELYHLNKQRLSCWDEDLILTWQSKEFKAHHQKLSSALAAMETKRQRLLQQDLQVPQKKVLESLGNHWSGLTLFLDNPQIPMDNNTSEQKVRGPVTGRKVYYGSGSVWSAQLLSILLTVIKTIELWGLNPEHWLHAYLTAIAENNSQVPEDFSQFLPWEMTPDRLNQFKSPRSQPKKIDTS